MNTVGSHKHTKLIESNKFTKSMQTHTKNHNDGKEKATSKRMESTGFCF